MVFAIHWHESAMGAHVFPILNPPAAAAAKSLQSCPTLCDPIDGSPPGSSIPGILRARTLEWVAISFSNAWKWKVKVKSLSHVQLLATQWTAAYQASPSMGFSRQEYWSGVPLPSLWTLLNFCYSWLHTNKVLKFDPQSLSQGRVQICNIFSKRCNKYPFSLSLDLIFLWASQEPIFLYFFLVDGLEFWGSFMGLFMNLRLLIWLRSHGEIYLFVSCSFPPPHQPQVMAQSL